MTYSEVKSLVRSLSRCFSLYFELFMLYLLVMSFGVKTVLQIFSPLVKLSSGSFVSCFSTNLYTTYLTYLVLFETGDIFTS